MKLKTKWFVPIVFCMLIAGFVSMANADTIVMKINNGDEIQGTVTITGYERAIAINSFTWGTTAQVDDPNGGNLVPQPPKTHNVVIDKLVDGATPQIVDALHRGEVFNTIEIDVVRTVQGQPTSIISLVLENAFFQSHSLKVLPNADGTFHPHEGYAIFFQKYTITCFQIDNMGQLASRYQSGWDYTNNSEYSQ